MDTPNQGTDGLVFSNVGSPDATLYLAPNPDIWTAALLPADSKFADKTMTLAQSTQLQVYYLFAPTAPSDMEGFIKAIRLYIDKNYRGNFSNNLTIVWLYQPDEVPGASNTLVWPLYVNAQSQLLTAQTLNWSGGNELVQVRITNNTQVNLVPEEAPTEFEFVYSRSSSNFGFSSDRIGSDTLMNQDVSLTFTGPGSASIRFPVGFNLQSDFSVYSVQNAFYYPNPDTEAGGDICLAYPYFQQGSNKQYAMAMASIYPLDLLNAKQLKTYFAFTGETYDQSSGGDISTVLKSNYPINTGSALNFFPKTDFQTVAAEPINNQYPASASAKLVFSPQDKTEQLRYYLQPEGEFYMAPPPEQASHADPDGKFDFLPGLSGTETISFVPYTDTGGSPSGDRISFRSLQHAFAPDFPPVELNMANPGNNNPTLDDTYFTCWANILGDSADEVQYSAQPTGASLYAKDHGVAPAVNGRANLLGFYEPSVDMPQGNFLVPMAPYLNVPPTANAPQNSQYLPFESQVLSKLRKSLIMDSNPPARASKSSLKRQAMAANGTQFTPSTTPQGLLAHVMNDGSWSLLNLAQNSFGSGAAEYLSPVGQTPADPPEYQMSFINLQKELTGAFLTNQQFLVVTQSNFLGELYAQMDNPGHGETSKAVFNNKMAIEDWPMDVNVGTNNTYADYTNVMIFKFCKGTLYDRAKKPDSWTFGEMFNTQGTADPQAKYQQVIAISSWIQAYFDDAEKSYQQGIENPNTNQQILFEKFHKILHDENWNGILCLKVDIDLQEFPQQLKGLISGIDLNRFNGHHLGFEMNRVDAAEGINMEKVSSIFGLINYLDTSYQTALLEGVDPEKPIPPTKGKTYDFKVLQLQVLFANTTISFFQSKVQLTMNELFSDTVTHTNNALGAEKLNTVVLNGTYQDHDGTPVYVFENTDDNLFFFDANVLKNVEISKIQFNTLTTDPNATEIQSRFTMWGYLNFAEIFATVPDEDVEAADPTYVLDAFSFGQKNPDNSYSDGLNYSNLAINMEFNIDTPTVVDFAFDASKIVFNSNQSYSRPLSLYPNFALQINNLISGTGDKKPSTLGYLTLATPGLAITTLGDTWYALELTLNMGTPGELAASMNFNSTLVLAWSPGEKASSRNYKIFVGIKLPGTSSNAKLLSLQGILKLSIQDLKLEYVTQDESYLMTLSNIALKFLGLVSLPPGGTTNFLLFGNPSKGATAKSLGWYAAYNKTT